MVQLNQMNSRARFTFKYRISQSRISKRLPIHLLGLLTIIFVVSSSFSLPPALAQDIAPDETLDPMAGEPGIENEVDTFPYTPNVFPFPTGHESAFNGANQIYFPAIEMQQSGEEGTTTDSTVPLTYYVDCSVGNDSFNGRSRSQAWRSLAPVYDATLNPGDSLLLKRGCNWTGPLDLKWQGTVDQPILIGAYGSGDLPKIQNAYSANVRISGKYQIIQDIHATMSTSPNPDPNCNNQPRGWKSGFSFEDDSSNNTVRTVKATRLTIGVFFHTGSHHNRLVNSTITDNNVLETLTATGAHGATGVSLHGNYHEIARNYFANNRSICTYNGTVESISIELYTASNANIHHNTIYNDRVFVETGSTPQWTSENNTLAYNLFVSHYDNDAIGARFLVTRGYGHVYGPVLNTIVLNNVVYITGAGSKGLTCQMCDNGILTARNNILWANDEPFSTDNRFIESHNIYWSNDGLPGLRWRGFTKDDSSIIANPQFINPSNNNFGLQAESPAINAGVIDSLRAGYRWDLLKEPVPYGGAIDIGAIERR